MRFCFDLHFIPNSSVFPSVLKHRFGDVGLFTYLSIENKEIADCEGLSLSSADLEVDAITLLAGTTFRRKRENRN